MYALCYSPQRKHSSNYQLLSFIYLGFYVAFNTVQVIARWVVGRAEETSTYSWSRFCTVNCRPTASDYQLSHLRPGREPNPSLRGGRRECTTLPLCPLRQMLLYIYKMGVHWHFRFAVKTADNTVEIKC